MFHIPSATSQFFKKKQKNVSHSIGNISILTEFNSFIFSLRMNEAILKEGIVLWENQTHFYSSLKIHPAALFSWHITWYVTDGTEDTQQ